MRLIFILSGAVTQEGNHRVPERDRKIEKRVMEPWVKYWFGTIQGESTAILYCLIWHELSNLCSADCITSKACVALMLLVKANDMKITGYISLGHFKRKNLIELYNITYNVYSTIPVNSFQQFQPHSTEALETFTKIFHGAAGITPFCWFLIACQDWRGWGN